LAHSLRTNSLQVYYCGLGFNIGGSTSESPGKLIDSYEKEIMPLFPEYFRDIYYAIKD